MNPQEEAFLKKLREAFKGEAKERTQKISSSLLALEKKKKAEEKKILVEIIYREMHSLKSAARAVNLVKVEKICQYLEDVLSIWKHKALVPSTQQFDILHKTIDFIEYLIKNSESTDNISDESFEKLLEDIENLKKSDKKNRTTSKGKQDIAPLSPPIEEIEDTVRISSLKLDALLVQAEEMLANKLNILNRATEFYNLKNSIVDGEKELEKCLPEKGFFKKNFPQMLDNSEKVKLIEFQQKYLDFLTVRDKNLKRTFQNLEMFSTLLSHDLNMFSTGIDNFLEDAKKLLMWPFSSLLNTFPKIVRDLSRSQEKEVNLIIEGSEVEIDKRILAEMKDVLLHLMRNSIGHGIEKPDGRIALNKPVEGQLKISIEQLTGNEISIQIADDGGGIDVGAVKEVAIKQGLLTREAADKLNADEAVMLIFQTGVSTSPILTELSGRGLGMSIIKEKIEKIGGKISIVNAPGKGTTIKISLPLTLATFKGVLISVEDQLFVIPIASLERIIRITPSEIKTIENKETILYQGQTTSLVWMSHVLGMNPKQTINEAENPILLAIVLNSGDKKIAFVVEEVLEEQEILVKNFEKPIVSIKNISAAAILGNGKPVPILNCLDLFQSVQLPSIGKPLAGKELKLKNQKRKLLLAEDSITTRMLLKNVLELGGYEVITAVDGLEALELLRLNDFSLVVSDVEMPRMDGFSLTRKIREDKKYVNLPIVLVTSRETSEDRERGIEAGANAYIPKSTFDSKHLVEIIQRMVA